MADIASNLFSKVLPRLGHEPGLRSGFQGWIVSGVYVPAEASPGREVDLHQVKTLDFVPYAAFDFERFALSCREILVIKMHSFMVWEFAKGFTAPNIIPIKPRKRDRRFGGAFRRQRGPKQQSQKIKEQRQKAKRQKGKKAKKQKSKKAKRQKDKTAKM